MINKVLTAVVLTASSVAFAQQLPPIERVKASDGELTCRQMYDESGAMDREIAEARRAQETGENTATAGQVGNAAAEVANRTGLFGQVGGLFGQIAGAVVAKTAAGMTEQSGKQSATRAQEREKQALARKEHLTTLFVARGCKASNPDAPATQSAPAVSVPKPAVALAPEEVLRRVGASITPVSGDLAFESRGPRGALGKRVFVPGFRVAFVTQTGTSAYSGAGAANLGNQAKGFSVYTITQRQSRSVEMRIAGVEPALLQSLTDRLYADFIEQLRQSGREVVDLDTIKKTAGADKLKFVAQKPYQVSPTTMGDPRSYIVMAPSALPLFFMHIDSYLGNAGNVDLDSNQALHELAARLDATAVIPTLTIDIGQLESSGRSNFGVGAQAEVTPALGVGPASEVRFVTGKDARIFYTGDIGALAVKKPLYLDGAFGDVRVVDAYNDAQLVNAITAATGMQGTQNISEKRELAVDREKYAAGVLRLGASFQRAALAAAQ